MDVVLRPVEERDLVELERLDLDPSVSEPFQWRGFRDWRSRRRRWELDGYLGDDDALLIVARNDTFAGIVVWSWVNTAGPRGCIQIGILLLPEHRRCGIGTVAQRLLANYLFAHTTVNRLEATTQLENVAEQRALERAGFQREGLLRGRGWVDGAWRDGYIYARLRTDPPPP
ncbi:MAG TPA: GNAT family protein [Acidimicrobiales bacterium]|nr:GNAT family protein [Acidimicrobiales bacterium]